MSIFMSKFAGDDYSAMQGPCPSGFHVPSKDEWQTVFNTGVSLGVWTTSNGTAFKRYLKIPMAGYRDRISDLQGQGSYGMYWSRNIYDNDHSYSLEFSSGTIRPADYSYYKSCGFSIRAFKDTSVVPDSSRTVLYQGTGSAGIYHNATLGLISISSDGTTRYTMQDKNLGATEVYEYTVQALTEANCGKFYQWGNNYGFSRSGSITTSSTLVDASSYGPGNFYNSSTFITTGYNGWDTSNNKDLWGGETGVVQNTGEPKKIYIRVEAQPITTSGIYHNSDLGLISLSSDGSNWITIADKNLGATTVYNNGDTMSEANCGKYYQWGNNYGFPRTGSVTTSSTRVNASSYGPGNYYNSSTFITGVMRDSSGNQNLWGGTTDTNSAKQGPCDSGYHIPSKTEYINLLSLLTNIGIDATSRGSTFNTYLLMPLSGNRKGASGDVSSQGTAGYYWSVSFDTEGSSSSRSASSRLCFGADITPNTGTNETTYGETIRPFKNEAVQPDTSRTKLY